MHLLNSDQNLIYEIEQVKNSKIFPPFKINSVELSEKKKFETYYSGDLNLSILNNNDNYQIVYNGISELDEKTKIVNLKTGDKKLYIYPYNWNKKQELIIKLNIFDKEYIISNQIKSYAKFMQNIYLYKIINLMLILLKNTHIN
ncbi:hypothetical protein [Mesoplasma melaleucae]|uniref:Uncharacterized protein n=1 Tax=Mesoplasma melaleucae TaxID=81459 RepID=A0A2K8P083_9MOLU|nr:hypothetical protein [Mesoplasma melaleucae]ATZ18303.1 hypothetical protein EMELA_v1c08160 [Mesoplasma melaleucae]